MGIRLERSGGISMVTATLQREYDGKLGGFKVAHHNKVSMIYIVL